MIGLKESFQLMYSNTHLKSSETLPLNSMEKYHNTQLAWRFWQKNDDD